jgi:glycosyltransferase involved in cell wall biosynthesis
MAASELAARVAVVVPCFNDGATLGEAVASVRAQQTPVELVVVDDGSTDTRTLEVLDALKRDGVHVVHQANAGLAAARMSGVRATEAPYVLPLDGDDLLEPDTVSVLASALDANPGAAVAWGDLQIFGIGEVRVPSAPALDAWLLTFTCTIPAAGGSMLRREALEAVGGWQLREGEDWDLWLALAEAGWPGVYVRRVAYRYRRTGTPRLAVAVVGEMTAYYDVLCQRHERLWEKRDELRARSPAPGLLKLALSGLERTPLSRLAKIQLAQLFCLLLWNRELRATGRMLVAAIHIRLPRRAKD